jgi:hypothetical protein
MLARTLMIGAAIAAGALLLDAGAASFTGAAAPDRRP